MGMDGKSFDVLVRRVLGRPSRRGMLRAGAGSLVTAALAGRGLSAPDDVEAKKKPCPPCKKRKKGKCKGSLPDGTGCTNGTCQGGRCIVASDPDPVGPVTTADATCLDADENKAFGLRLVQTFRALRSGHLTSASVELTDNVAGADFDMEIWSVDQDNVPNAVLAGVTIADVPATGGGVLRTLSGTFPGPATVVAGLRYALVVTIVGPNQSFGLHYATIDNCPDGNMFQVVPGGGPLVSEPTSDLVFATFVTA
jgi:hypothetical protein